MHLVFIQAAPTAEDSKVQTSVKDGGDGGQLEAKDSKESISSSSCVTVALPESSASPGAASSEVDSAQLNGMHLTFSECYGVLLILSN